MGENAVELIFKVSADSTHADQATAAFGANVDASMNRFVAASKAAAQSAASHLAELKIRAQELKQHIDATRASMETMGRAAPSALAPFRAEAVHTQAELEVVNAEIKAIEKAITSVGQQSVPAMAPMGNSLRQAQASAMILERQFGLHMPRAINTMLARTELIGPMLQAAFGVGIAILFIENIGKVEAKIKSLALAVGGFGEDAQAAFQNNIKANDDLLLHFEGLTTAAKIATGNYLIAQTNLQLAALEGQKAAFNWMAAGEQLHMKWYEALLGPAGIVLGLKRASEALTDKTKLTNEESKLQKQLAEQLRQLGELEKDRAKEGAKDAKARQRHFEEQMRHLNEFNQRLIEERTRAEKHWQSLIKEDVKELGALEKAAERAMGMTAGKPLASPFALWAVDVQKLTEAQRAALPLNISTTNQLAMMVQRTKEWTAEMIAHHIPARRRLELQMQHEVDLGQREVEEMRQKVGAGKALRSELEAVEEQYRRLTAALQQYQQAQQQELTLSGSWTRALDEETGAIQANMAAAVEGLASEAAAMIGGRRAQAAVEGAFDTAKAIEMWARFAASWGTDASAGIAAAKYTLAAVEMFKVAGSGGGSVSAGGGAFGGDGGSMSRRTGGGSSAGGGRERPAGVTIVIQGDYLATPASVDQLAALLSEAVDRRDVRLAASTAKDSTLTRDSLNG